MKKELFLIVSVEKFLTSNQGKLKKNPGVFLMSTDLPC